MHGKEIKWLHVLLEAFTGLEKQAAPNFCALTDQVAVDIPFYHVADVECDGDQSIAWVDSTAKDTVPPSLDVDCNPGFAMAPSSRWGMAQQKKKHCSSLRSSECEPCDMKPKLAGDVATTFIIIRGMHSERR